MSAGRFLVAAPGGGGDTLPLRLTAAAALLCRFIAERRAGVANKNTAAVGGSPFGVLAGLSSCPLR